MNKLLKYLDSDISGGGGVVETAIIAQIYDLLFA